MKFVGIGSACGSDATMKVVCSLYSTLYLSHHSRAATIMASKGCDGSISGAFRKDPDDNRIELIESASGALFGSGRDP